MSISITLANLVTYLALLSDPLPFPERAVRLALAKVLPPFGRRN
jgi:hypothetical protein